MRGVERLLQHVSACNNARLPGVRLRLCVGKAIIGYLRPDLAGTLAAFPELGPTPGGLALRDPAALPDILRTLADQGAFRWRGEAFDVRAEPNGPVLTQADRGALPLLGLVSVGVHVNGLVRRSDGLHVWIGRRAPDKHLDPDKLDHLVAGGVPAGLSPQATLVKEAAEEAAIPAELAVRAVPVGRIAYAMERPEGLRRDLLLCYDLDLPEDFVPRPADGEVADFMLWPVARVLETVAAGDTFKFNVNLVLIDLFIRHGLIEDAEAARLRAALSQPARGAPGTPAP